MDILKKKKKEEYKEVKSFGLSPRSIENLESMSSIWEISKSQVVEQLINYFHDYKTDFAHSFELAIEPQIKKRPRFGGGNTYTHEDTKRYETHVKMALRKWWKEKPIEGPIRTEIIFQFSAPKTSKNGYPGSKDVDNLVKAGFDGANGVVWKDDRQVCSLSAKKIFGIDDRIIFRFSELEIDLDNWKKLSSSYKWVGD